MQISFDGRITLGSAVTLVALIGGLAAGWAHMESAINQQTRTLAAQDRRIDSLESLDRTRASAFADLRDRMVRLETRSEIQTQLLQEIRDRTIARPPPPY